MLPQANPPAEHQSFYCKTMLKDFCFEAAVKILVRSVQNPVLVPASILFLSVLISIASVLNFVSDVISSKFPLPAKVLERLAITLGVIVFFFSLYISFPLGLKFIRDLLERLPGMAEQHGRPEVNTLACWKEMVNDFCLGVAEEIALQSVRIPIPIVPSILFLYALVLFALTSFISSLIFTKYPSTAKAFDWLGIWFGVTDCFFALFIPFQLGLPSIPWMICACSLFSVFFCNFLL